MDNLDQDKYSFILLLWETYRKEENIEFKSHQYYNLVVCAVKKWNLSWDLVMCCQICSLYANFCI